MDQLLGIADIILKLWWALVVLLLIVLLIYMIRVVLIAKWIIGGVKKTVETAQQNIVSPMNILWSFFWDSSNDFDED